MLIQLIEEKTANFETYQYFFVLIFQHHKSSIPSLHVKEQISGHFLKTGSKSHTLFLWSWYVLNTWDIKIFFFFGKVSLSLSNTFFSNYSPRTYQERMGFGVEHKQWGPNDKNKDSLRKLIIRKKSRISIIEIRMNFPLSLYIYIYDFHFL